MNDLDLNNPEVVDFRLRMKEMCERLTRAKECQGWLERATSLYPPDVVTDGGGLPDHLSARLGEQGTLLVSTRIEDMTVKMVFVVFIAVMG